jgi:hypothetical protein
LNDWNDSRLEWCMWPFPGRVIYLASNLSFCLRVNRYIESSLTHSKTLNFNKVFWFFRCLRYHLQFWFCEITTPLLVFTIMFDFGVMLNMQNGCGSKKRLVDLVASIKLNEAVIQYPSINNSLEIILWESLLLSESRSKNGLHSSVASVFQFNESWTESHWVSNFW